MDKPDTIVSVFTNAANVLAFVVFIVPGFVSLRTYEALRGGEGRKINETLVDVVIYSFASDIVAVPLLYLTSTWQAISWFRITCLAVESLLALLILPCALGWLGFAIRQRLARNGLIAHPTLKPWDEIFTRIAREKHDIGVILTTPDGRKFGGRYVDPGFASEYPADEQVLLGEAWSVDQASGRFVEKVSGSYGILIDKKDVLTVEFVEWNTVAQYLRETKHGSESSQDHEPDRPQQGARGTEDPERPAS